MLTSFCEIQPDNRGGDTMDTQADRRKITRVDYAAKGQAEHNGRLFHGELINISLNGLLFRSDEPMDVSEQDEITVMINLDDKEKKMVSEINCIVVRKNDYVLGLRFKFIDYDTLMLLKEKLSNQTGNKINEEFIDFILGTI